MRTLKEGIHHRKVAKKGKKNRVPRQLQEAMREALKAQKKQVGCYVYAHACLAHVYCTNAKGLYWGWL